MDNHHLTEDQKDTRLLADILALILDEEAGQASAALETLRQRARQRKVSGGTLKNLFKTLAEHERKASLSPQAFQDELRQELHQQQNTAEELAYRHRQLQSDYALLQEENALLQQNNADHIRQIPWRRAVMIITLIIGIILGIAGTQLVRVLTDPPHINPALCLH